MDNRNVVWTNDSALVTCMLIKIVIIILCVYPIIQYGFYSDSNTDLPPETANASDIIDSNSSAVVNKNHTTPNRRFTVVKQPTCSNKFAKELEMQEILYELHVKNEMCTPEDINNLEKHRIPKLPPKRNETSNPRGTIVVYFAVGLLLTSLGAACLEFFKAKGQLPAKSKTPLTRKCSLADLTVLRHTRKELVRRESVMEGVDHPGSLRASVLRPAPLHRRCSFPVAPGEARSGSSMVQQGGGSPTFRRQISRRVSIDNEASPERRHSHARLVRRF